MEPLGPILIQRHIAMDSIRRDGPALAHRVRSRGSRR